MTRSPIDALIDSVVKCVECGAAFGQCDCWETPKKLSRGACLSTEADPGFADASGDQPRQSRTRKKSSKARRRHQGHSK